MADYLAHIVPTAALIRSTSGAMSRNRIFSKGNTFWAFFSQILDADGGCQEVVRKLQAVAVQCTPNRCPHQQPLGTAKHVRTYR
jgi:hypothetical protein